MTRDWKYILYISLAIGVFVILKMMSPKQYNWTITYSAEDKNPFGGYALNQLLRTHVPSLKHSYKTLYELKDSIKTTSSVFVVSESFAPGEEDAIALLDHVHAGGRAFVSARHFSGTFADTLKLKVDPGDFVQGKDSSSLRLVASNMDTVSSFFYEERRIDGYFRNFDTTRTTVISVNEEVFPVTIRMKWGKGDLILNSTPIMFTNMFLLAGDNHKFVSSQLSYLPDTELTWTEYYQLGRREISTPLRFILLNEPLAWAYYVSVISLLAFMLFEMKRRQRIIPVIKPLGNTTLEFVATIGDLYYQNGDHRNIADKKVIYFLEYVRTKFSLSTNQLDPAFASALAKKSGRDEKDISKLLWAINEVKTRPVITSDHLIELNSRLESFYNRR
ncbi:MAG: DUF4350 domain-containing protein [Chryseolinea sp.]